MKIKVILLILAIILTVDCAHMRTKRKIDIFNSLVNRTNSITNYVKEKGRSLKNFYNRQVSTIFGEDIETNEVEDETETVSNKFKHYIDKAAIVGKTVYDVIAPAKAEYECDDKVAINTMTTTQLTAIHGYVSEAHTVLTEDGYLLTVHRIPYSKKSKTKEIPSKTVLLHHGLLGSSSEWVLSDPEKSLGFMLSDAGYDVWMANVRGNTYSKSHAIMRTNSYEFWNFTFHEVGQNDLPAVIDYIVERKGSNAKINYVGFSMGTTALFTLLSTKTEYNNILNAGFAMAPVAFMTGVRGPLKTLSQFGNQLQYLFKLFGTNEFLPRNAVARYLSKHSCKIGKVEEAVCEISMFLLCGHDKVHFDRSLIPKIYGHIPAGSSTKTLGHFSQLIKSGKFQQFDYGTEGNVYKYGNPDPPEYNLTKITLPIALLSAKGDWISSVGDAERLFGTIMNPIEHYVVTSEDFTHLNFLFAEDAYKLVYMKLLTLIDRHN